MNNYYLNAIITSINKRDMKTIVSFRVLHCEPNDIEFVVLNDTDHCLSNIIDFNTAAEIIGTSGYLQLLRETDNTFSILDFFPKLDPKEVIK